MNVREVLPRDAIPSIDEPSFGQDYFGEGSDEVIVVHGDPARAYPIRILSYHEVVNDEIAGEHTGRDAPGPAPPNASQPIAVTWCPICWSAVVYDRRVNGQTLSFGMSGKLADDALVLYDRETESEWKQPTGEAFAGPLAGTKLDTLPAPLTTWERFRQEYPTGLVLQPPRASADTTELSPEAVYDMDRYEQYVAGEAYGLFGMRGEGEPRTWDRDDIEAKTIVLGVEHDEDATAYPIPVIDAAGGVVTDTVGGLDILVVVTETGIHAYRNPGFPIDRQGDVLLGDGTTWDPLTGAAEDGRQLVRVHGRRMFAFAWQDAHGDAAFYG